MVDKSWTDRQLLELFVQRARELYSRGIWKDGGLGFKIEINNDSTSFQQPDEELFRSYIMSFRHFVQDQEPVFFGKARNLTSRYLKPDMANEHIKLKNMKIRWQHVLDIGELQVGIVGGDPLKPKDVLDAFLNGEYFHSDRDHRVLLANYASEDDAFVRALLLDTIAFLSSIIFELGNFIDYALNNDWFNFPNNDVSES